MWERGSGWGTLVNPWLIHVNVWQKPLQYCKVISLQLIKINEKKKEEQRHYSAHKSLYSQGYGLPSGHIWLWELSIKKAKCQRIDAFKLWCWSRLPKVPWTSRRSNKASEGRSTLNIHWSDWCWSWSSRILVIWCAQMTHWQWTWIWANSRRWWGTGRPVCCSPWGCKESDVTAQLNNNNWHISLCKFKVQSMMAWFTYTVKWLPQ